MVVRTMMTYGLDQFDDYVGDDFEALLLKPGWALDQNIDRVSDINLATYEVDFDGYARADISGKDDAVHIATRTRRYTCDSIDFGVIDPGEDVEGMLVYRFITDDANSIPVVHFSWDPITTIGDNFVVNTSATGLWKVTAG